MSAEGESDDRRRASVPAIQQTWDALAPAYDTLASFHDHSAWAAQVDGLAREAGLAGRRLLDVGCGTGSSTAAMRERGYEVVGVDVSPRMLEVAEQRLGPGVELHRHDVRELPALGTFDVVWGSGDVMNFLLSDAELVAAFCGFRRNLADGGFAVFDVDTLASFRTLYSSLLVVPADERIVVFEGQADGTLESGDTAEALIDSLEPASSPWWRRVRAVHRQRHHAPATIEAALDAAGLDLAAVWGTDGAGGSQRPLDEERHNKAVYIARNGGARRAGEEVSR
jgi:SAM-dependent methyltransferase